MVPEPHAPQSAPAEVFLVTGYLGGGGGAERQVVELASHLGSLPFRASVLCLVPASVRAKHGGHYYERLEQAGIEVVTLPRRGRSGPLQLIRLARFLRSRRPALVHSFSFSQNWRTRLASLVTPGTRVIASERTLASWKRPRHHALDRILARRTDRIVVNADAIRRSLVEEGRISPEKISVIPNGVDTSTFRPRADRREARRKAGWGESEIAMGHVGTMAAHKGQRPVLDAFALARRELPHLRLTLVGDGSHRPSLEARARELGIADRVQMPGFVRDVASTLGLLDVYVHLSVQREGCSNAILEAMACGLPVVASDVGGNRELVEHGETGFLVAEDDREEAAGRLRQLAEDDGLRRDMGKASLERVRERFSVERMIAATAALYRELLES
jgi:glycosyltransferase involved in cell wall biosynthesis